jgi:phosphoribosyl-ATP pyrophosphohydrolase
MNTPGEGIVDSVEISTLEGFDSWVAQDWLFDRGSDEAQVHVRGKLREEANELAEVLTSNHRSNILDELGDFLWTANANGLNSGITSCDSLRHELREDQIGIGPISLDRIDKLALELIPDLPADQMEGWVKYLGHYLGKAAKQWRVLSPSIDIDAKPQNFAEAWTLLKRARTYDALTQSVLITSALAQRYADTTLSGVIIRNVNKLKSRKAAGLPVTSPVE